MCSLWGQDELPGLSTILGRFSSHIFLWQNYRFSPRMLAATVRAKEKAYKNWLNAFSHKALSQLCYSVILAVNSNLNCALFNISLRSPPAPVSAAGFRLRA